MTPIVLSRHERHSFASVYRWTLSEHKGLSILYGVLLFLGFPFFVLLVALNNAGVLDDIEVSSLVPVTYSLTMLFTLVYSGVLFCYMHQKRTVDLFYALPVRRGTLLMARYCAGATEILLPLLANYLLTVIIASFTPSNGPQLMSFQQGLLLYILLLCLAVLASMAFTMFIAVCSGNLMDTILSTIIINLAYPVLILSVWAISTGTLKGITVSFPSSYTLFTLLCPYGSVLSIFFLNLSPFRQTDMVLYVVWWLAFTVAFLALSLWLGHKRKGESAESSAAFPAPMLVIRTIVVITAGLLGGYVVCTMLDGALVPFIVGMVLGSAAAHLVLEAIYSRGLKKLHKSLPWYGGTLVVMALILAVLDTGVFGIAYRIPAVEDVESVYVYINDSRSLNIPKMSSISGVFGEIVDGDYRPKSPVLESAEEIANVTDLHRQLLDVCNEKFLADDLRSSGASVTLTYTMRNGRKITRSFQGYSLDTMLPDFTVFARLVDSEEYVKGSNLAFQINASDVKTIEYQDSDADFPMALLATDAQKQELLEALRQDVLADTLQQQLDYVDSYNWKNMPCLYFDSYVDSYDQPVEGKVGFANIPYPLPDYYTNTLRVLSGIRTSESEE